MTDPLLLDTATRVFRDTCDFEAVQRAEAEGFAPAAWAAAATVGLPWISVPAESGGSGGTLSDALAVLRLAGRAPAPLPLAETGVLAGWLLTAAGLEPDEAPATVVPGSPDDDLALVDGHLRGVARRVPWARVAGRIAAILDADGTSAVVVVRGDAARIQPQANLAGEPRDTISFDGAVPEVVVSAPAGVDRATLELRGALTRVALMAGALDRMSELTVEYTSERRQFGRPVGAFQAVQQHLVHGAQEAALVSVAADVAAREVERGAGRFEVGAAKLLANQAAHVATRAAHQAHGAMGMTQEYGLHHLSRRLWAWRSEFGDERRWADELGASVAALGADQLYPAITAGSALVAG